MQRKTTILNKFIVCFHVDFALMSDKIQLIVRIFILIVSMLFSGVIRYLIIKYIRQKNPLFAFCIFSNTIFYDNIERYDHSAI